MTSDQTLSWASAPACSARDDTDTAQLELQRLMRQEQVADLHVAKATCARMLVAQLEPALALGGAWQVRDEQGHLLSVERAHSCLMAPQPGDVVQLVCTVERCWVVAVLVSATPEAGLVLDASGRRLSLQAQELHLCASAALHQQADVCSSFSRLSLQTSQERQARIHGTDSTRAANALTRVDKHHSVHAGNASLTASTLLKVDAAQIHMG